MLGVRWQKASSLTRHGSWERRIRGSSLIASARRSGYTAAVPSGSFGQYSPPAPSASPTVAGIRNGFTG